jgi:mitochondrial FAD-linked sulfhydryl oxidase
MDQKVWGPPAWFFLHTVVANYPEKTNSHRRIHYKNFFHELAYILPCKNCRKHYQQNIKDLPIEPFLADRSLLILWMWTLHDRINQMCHKSSPPLSEVIKQYNKLRVKKNKKKT